MVFLTNVLSSLWRKTARVSRAKWPARGRNRLTDNIKHIRRKEDNQIQLLNPQVIRLAMGGCTNRPYYRIVVSYGYRDRDDEVEQLGTFDPMPNMFNEKLCGLNFKRLKYYIGMGAHLTKPVRRLLGLSGFLPMDPTLIFHAQMLRRRRLIEEKIRERDAEENPKTDEASQS